jgi:hypothetical protein
MDGGEDEFYKAIHSGHLDIIKYYHEVEEI